MNSTRPALECFLVTSTFYIIFTVEGMLKRVLATIYIAQNWGGASTFLPILPTFRECLSLASPPDPQGPLRSLPVAVQLKFSETEVVFPGPRHLQPQPKVGSWRAENLRLHGCLRSWDKLESFH